MLRSLYILTVILALAGLLPVAAVADAVRPNVLVITVDDMNADSVGAFGAAVTDATPNIDRLAASGIRFGRAHVQVANCKPSRNVMWSGRYPHSNRVEGFYPVRDANYPTLMSELRDAGYFIAVRNKLTHTTPSYPFAWDAVLDDVVTGGKPHAKDPASYGVSVREGIRLAKAAGKPFFLMLNIDDPHLPFYALDHQGNSFDDPYVPSRVYTPAEVPVPGFLFDDAVVRRELAHYYSSVRRADDAVGSVLEALANSGQAANTVVMFLSDHGMPLPFAKTQLYHHSTRTPLVMRWPGITTAGSVDEEHMVSAVDLMPTLLEGLGLDVPAGIQGRSFLPLLSGLEQAERSEVFKAFNENAGGQRAPMRAIETDRFLYIFNPWSSEPPSEFFRPWSFGRFDLWSAARGTGTFRRMEELGKYDRRLAWRVDLFKHRVPEELFDITLDPDCLNNLVHDPAYAEQLQVLRDRLGRWMDETGDHALTAFESRDNPAALAAYVREQNTQSAQRKRDALKARNEAIARAMIAEQASQQSPQGGGQDVSTPEIGERK